MPSESKNDDDNDVAVAKPARRMSQSDIIRRRLSTTGATLDPVILGLIDWVSLQPPSRARYDAKLPCSPLFVFSKPTSRPKEIPSRAAPVPALNPPCHAQP